MVRGMKLDLHRCRFPTGRLVERAYLTHCHDGSLTQTAHRGRLATKDRSMTSGHKDINPSGIEPDHLILSIEADGPRVMEYADALGDWGWDPHDKLRPTGRVECYKS